MNWEDDRRIATNEPPLLQTITLIAEEICPKLFDCYYREIDPLAEPEKLRELFRKATIVHYMRRGINPTPWITSAEATPLLAFV